MRIKNEFMFITSDIERLLSEVLVQQGLVFDSKSLTLAHWEDEHNKQEKGLVISIAKDQMSLIFFNQLIKKLNFTKTTILWDELYIGFDDNVTFFKYCKAHYSGNDKDDFSKHYQDFLKAYVRQLNRFSLNSAMKPSVVATEILGKPIDWLDNDNFKEDIAPFNYSLTNALIKERGLRHYPYAYGSSRFHLLKFSLGGVREQLSETDRIHFDKAYGHVAKNDIRGDALKAVILAKIQKEIGRYGSGTPGEIKEKWLEIQNRYDYKLLAQSQGITTKLLGVFHVKTSSINALNKWMNFTYPELMKPEISPKSC